MTETSTTIPLAVSVQLAHAAIQVLAEDAGVDVLHIKGPAVDPELLARRPVENPETGEVIEEPQPRDSIDADVLVRPSQVGRLLRAMEDHGWRLKVPFADGSSFEHAATLGHHYLGHVDIHRSFPGFGLTPTRAFDRLWQDRAAAEIGGLRCEVPSLTAQRLLLILHAARGGSTRREDIVRAWDSAGVPAQEAVTRLAAELKAEVALAAGTGRLDEFAGAREHDLWQYLSTGGGSPALLWWARVRAAPDFGSAVRIGAKLILPRVGRLAVELGRRPTPRRGRRAVGPAPRASCAHRPRCAEAVVAAGIGSSMKYRVPDRVGYVIHQPDPHGPQEVFLMILPDGVPVHLSGSSAAIWLLAVEGADVFGELADVVGESPAVVERQAREFLDEVLRRGLLAAHSEGAP